MAVASRIPTLIAFTMLLAAFAGCTAPGFGDGDGADGEGSVAFFVKDAPTDELSGVFVTFTRVEVHHAGDNDSKDDGDDEDDDAAGGDDDNDTADDGNETGNDDNETVGNETDDGGADDNETDDDLDGGNETVGDDDNETSSGNSTGNDTGNATGNMTPQSVHSRAGWYIVFEGNETVDLMEFTGDARAFLGDGTVPAGKYTQIRIYVGDAWVEFADSNETAPLDIPSDTLKIVRPWTVEDGATTELTVDFDLEKHLKETGQGWKFVGALKLAVDHRADAETADEHGEDDRRGHGHGDDDNETRGRGHGDDGNESRGHGHGDDDNETDGDHHGSSNGGHGSANAGSNKGKANDEDDD